MPLPLAQQAEALMPLAVTLPGNGLVPLLPDLGGTCHRRKRVMTDKGSLVLLGKRGLALGSWPVGWPVAARPEVAPGTVSSGV